MFNLTTTIEDTTITATSEDGVEKWSGKITDGLTGESLDFEASGEEMSMVMALLLHPDGDSFDTNEAYEKLDGWLVKHGMQPGGENSVFRPVP